jgi:putative transposase
MVRQRKPPSQTCRSFLNNHVQSWHHSPFDGRTDRAQLREAFPWHRTPGCLLRDRDRIFGQDFVEQARAMGIKQVLSAPRSPWQRAYVEGVIGSIRRECLDHVIVLGGGALRRTLTAYFTYYHQSRTHLSLDKDAPQTRKRQGPSERRVIEIREVGGLHPHYERRAA